MTSSPQPGGQRRQARRQTAPSTPFYLHLSNTCEGTNGTAVSTSNSAGPDQFTILTVSGAGSSLNYSTDFAHSGFTSLKFVMAANVATVIQAGFGASNKLNPADVQRFQRIYIYVPTAAWPATATSIRLFNWSNAPTVRIDTTGHLTIYDTGGSLKATMSSAIPTGQWVRVEFDLTSIVWGSGATATVRMFSGANLETSTPDSTISQTGVSLGGTTILPDAKIGTSTSTTDTNGFTCYLDDYAVNTDVTPGPAPPVPIAVVPFTAAQPDEGANRARQRQGSRFSPVVFIPVAAAPVIAVQFTRAVQRPVTAMQRAPAFKWGVAPPQVTPAWTVARRTKTVPAPRPRPAPGVRVPQAITLPVLSKRGPPPRLPRTPGFRPPTVVAANPIVTPITAPRLGVAPASKPRVPRGSYAPGRVVTAAVAPPVVPAFTTAKRGPRTTVPRRPFIQPVRVATVTAVRVTAVKSPRPRRTAGGFTPPPRVTVTVTAPVIAYSTRAAPTSKPRVPRGWLQPGRQVTTVIITPVTAPRTVAVRAPHRVARGQGFTTPYKPAAAVATPVVVAFTRAVQCKPARLRRTVFINSPRPAATAVQVFAPQWTIAEPTEGADRSRQRQQSGFRPVTPPPRPVASFTRAVTVRAGTFRRPRPFQVRGLPPAVVVPAVTRVARRFRALVAKVTSFTGPLTPGTVSPNPPWLGQRTVGIRTTIPRRRAAQGFLPTSGFTPAVVVKLEGLSAGAPHILWSCGEPHGSGWSAGEPHS